MPNIQVPKTKLPSGADAEKRERLLARAVADVEAVRVEEADADGVALGRLGGGPIVNIFQ